MSKILDFPNLPRDNESFKEAMDTMVNGVLRRGLPKSEEEYKESLELAFGLASSMVNRWIEDSFGYRTDIGIERRDNLRMEIAIWVTQAMNKVIEDNNGKE